MMGELATYSPSSVDWFSQQSNDPPELSGRVQKLTDDDGPDVDEGEERDVCELLQWKQEREDVIGYTLRIAVQRMEGMACVRGRHDPFVMRLVEGLVD